MGYYRVWVWVWVWVWVMVSAVVIYAAAVCYVHICNVVGMRVSINYTV